MNPMRKSRMVLATLVLRQLIEVAKGLEFRGLGLKVNGSAIKQTPACAMSSRVA